MSALAAAPAGMASPANQTAVIVGAGPAGAVLAACLAARKMKVHVFERREQAATSTSRAIPLGLNGRSVKAVEAAGLTMEEVGLAPRKAMSLAGRMSVAPPNQDRLQAQYVADRAGIANSIVKAVQGKEELSRHITWHFGQVLEDVDFDARVATFVPFGKSAISSSSSSSSSRITAQYDLLVGADGASSAVRAKLMEHHVPGVSEEVLMENRVTYKTFGGLPATTDMEECLPGITTTGPGEVLFFLGEILDPVRRCVVWQRPDRAIAGVLGGPPEWHTDESLNALLNDIFRGPLRVWVPSIVAQLGPSQPHSIMGRIIKVSQFHGPSCVLVGDAAHSVTPNVGQGCNMALESVRVFTEILDRVGLEAAPAAFTAARLKDAHALQDLEYHLSVMLATGPMIIRGQARRPTALEALPSKMLHTVPTLVFALLKKLFPTVFTEPLLSSYLLSNANVPFSKVHAVYTAVGWGLPLAVLAAVGWALVKVVLGALAA